MPLISKESLASAMQMSALSGSSVNVKLNIEGWTQEFPVDTLRTLIALMLQNIDFRPSLPKNQRFLLEKDIFLTVLLPLPANQYTNVILPVLLGSAAAQEILGIDHFSAEEVPNPYKEYGLSHPLSFAQTLWRGDMSLRLSSQRVQQIHFQDFVGDLSTDPFYTTATGWKQRTSGHLYLAAYSLAVLPAEVWNQITTLNTIGLRDCLVMSARNRSVVSPDRSSDRSRHLVERIAFVSPTIGRSQVESGTIDTSRFYR